MAEQVNLLVESLRSTWTQLSAFLPRLIWALLLLLAGWLLARLIRRLAVRLMKLARLDTAAERAGLEDFLLRGGVRFTGVTLTAQIIYWGVMLLVTLTALDVLGLAVAATLIDRVVFYIPNVVVATIIVIFGTLLARFVQGATFTYLTNFGVAGAQAISRLAQWAIIIFVASVAAEQLSIGGQVLVSAFQYAFGGLCLALALAFGLGGRRWAEGILERTWKQRS